MDFYTLLNQAVDLLRQRQRITYRALKVQLHLDDEALEALKDELIEAQHLAIDEAGKVLVWTGAAASAPARRVSASPGPPAADLHRGSGPLKVSPSQWPCSSWLVLRPCGDAYRPSRSLKDP